MPEALEHEYVIIGGTTKAGTSSLFSYLADHPEIVPASFKETRFFLDDDYPVDSKYRYTGGLGAYEDYFTDRAGRVRLDATPDYLHSPGTAERIARSLPRARLVFVLRDPVARVISWYNFGRQRGLLPLKLTFGDYVCGLREVMPGPCRPQCYRVLEQGCYAPDVQRFFDHLGRQRVRVFFFEDFVEDPGAVVATLCEFAGIDRDFFLNYVFGVYNRTGRARSVWLHRLYTQARFHLRGRTRERRFLRQMLRGARRKVEPVYDLLNTGIPERIEYSSEPAKWLLTYYQDSIAELESLLGVDAPWPRFQKGRARR